MSHRKTSPGLEGFEPKPVAPNTSHLAGLILARDQLPLGVIAASEAESLIAQAMAAPATSPSQVAADPMAMIDLRVEALKASPWGEHADRTGAFVKGALWHAMRNGGQVAAEAVQVPELPAACCEVRDEKYNRVFFYRPTGSQAGRYHQPGTKLVALDEVEQVYNAMRALLATSQEKA